MLVAYSGKTEAGQKLYVCGVFLKSAVAMGLYNGGMNQSLELT